MITFTSDKYFKMPDTGQKGLEMNTASPSSPYMGLIFVASLNKFYEFNAHGPFRVYLFHTRMCTILHIVKSEGMQNKHK
jgi:hypothetical protein